MRVGIVGYGVVGGTLGSILESFDDIEVAKYDPAKGYDDLTQLENCELIFVSVWTPMDKKGLDTTHVFDAVKLLTASLWTPLIVVRSTVVPGTMTSLQQSFRDQDFAFVPEFLIEADPVGSTRNADRIIIGAYEGTERVWLLEELMRRVSPGSPVVRLTPEEAVMVKLASNGLLAAKVAIANELHDICTAYGVEWENVRGAVGLDRRIAPDHLRVTEERGYGGSCFPKDVQGLIGAAREAHGRASIFEEIQETNKVLRAFTKATRK